MKYRFLLFDADDTLFDFDQSSRQAFHEAMQVCGVQPQPRDYDNYAAINLALWKQFERGEIDKETILTKRFRDFTKKYRINADPDAINERYKAALSHKNILMPDALFVIETLFHQGYRLFIITNGDAAIQHKRLGTSPITPYIEKVFISEEIGHAKPSPLFFDAVADGISDFSKEQALVIGDSESSDIRGANLSGIDACYVSPHNTPLPDGIFANYTVRCLTDLLAILN
ncbi:MAG: YjjG family noncanonical pyrimidine nucleotidase [Clostridia bacterium]|nr:YjjG family noncanonical pyrimidine nucleotidase [Clostridia bacterium]